MVTAQKSALIGATNPVGTQNFARPMSLFGHQPDIAGLQDDADALRSLKAEPKHQTNPLKSAPNNNLTRDRYQSAISKTPPGTSPAIVALVEVRNNDGAKTI